MVDSVFILDIVINFRTTYINQKTGYEVAIGRLIALNYVMNWRFYFDLISVAPIETIYNFAVDENYVSANANNKYIFRILDFLKLFRLLRLYKIITYMKINREIKTGFRLFLLLGSLLLLVHWISCIWYLVVVNSDWVPPMDADYSTDFHMQGMWD